MPNSAKFMSSKNMLAAVAKEPSLASWIPKAILAPGALGITPSPQPTPTTPAPVPAQPGLELPGAPTEAVWCPIENLPFPAPGDRIKAEHFKALSQSILLVADSQLLASGLFGLSFQVARTALAADGYEIGRVISVYGRELAPDGGSGDDAAKVLDVRPSRLGARRVDLVVSEQAEERVFAPNLIGMTHADGRAALKAALGSRAAGPSAPAPNLVGRRLADITR